MTPSIPNGTPNHLICCIRLTKTGGVIILHNIAKPHVAKVCVEALALKTWESLKNPACSQDLSLCDCHIFGPLRKRLNESTISLKG
ncbi:hypothetical protein TNCV_425101 [Trichonephila clavipes]|nr:hypothetical protein TNCV_425101 [Trichonephila clavipes]